MARQVNLKVEKCAILLNRREVQAIQWRNYMEKNWEELTAHLQNATILFLTGRHGLEDGSIGPQDENVKSNQIRQVQFSDFVHFVKYTYFCIFRMKFLNERKNSAKT